VAWDGSTYLTGMFEELFITPTDSTTGNGYDIFVLAYHPSGDVRYVRSAGAGSADIGMASCLGPDQSLYLTGYYYYFADFDNSTIGAADHGDCFLARMTDILGVEEQNENQLTGCFELDKSTNSIRSYCDVDGVWSLSNTLGQILDSGRITREIQLPQTGNQMVIFSVNTSLGNYSWKLFSLTE